jgi:hypothetical protein
MHFCTVALSCGLVDWLDWPGRRIRSIDQPIAVEGDKPSKSTNRAGLLRP